MSDTSYEDFLRAGRRASDDGKYAAALESFIQARSARGGIGASNIALERTIVQCCMQIVERRPKLDHLYQVRDQAEAAKEAFKYVIAREDSRLQRGITQRDLGDFLLSLGGIYESIGWYKRACETLQIRYFLPNNRTRPWVEYFTSHSRLGHANWLSGRHEEGLGQLRHAYDNLQGKDAEHEFYALVLYMRAVSYYRMLCGLPRVLQLAVRLRDPNIVPRVASLFAAKP